MIKVGGEYQPFSMKIIEGGKYTQFAIPQRHIEYGSQQINDGVVNFVAKGEYDFEKGDLIIIKQIEGAKLKKYKGKQYFSLLGSIEVKTQAEKQAGQHWQTLNDNIPEDLL